LLRVPFRSNDCHTPKTKDNSEIIGGCEGNITDKFCYVHRMWVAPDHRDKGLGSRLIYQLENYARNNNCLTVSVDTAEFQAKGFYEKLGYLVVSIVDGVIFPGYKQYFMSKNL
jgi:ribosomal protein S18 acetylase RimI-like enzyme